MDKITFIQDIRVWSSQYPLLETITSLLFLLLLSFIANLIAKRGIVRGLRKILAKFNFSNHEIFSEHSVIRRIANIVPAIVIIQGINSIPHLSKNFIQYVQIFGQTFIFFTIALAMSDALNIFSLIYRKNPKSRNKPIKGYIQLIKIIVFIVCTLMILGTFLQRDIFTMLAGFGAMAAVLMLVFQNTILSLVASIQISSYDMIRIGDLIQMPSLKADGFVVDMSLNTITIENFDKTFMTIPTNKVITDTLKNWRSADKANIRRIKRSLRIDQNSIHFLTDQDIEKLKCFDLIKSYLIHKQKELDTYNHQPEHQEAFQQRKLTNFGTFRAYVKAYLEQHPQITTKELLMVRQLDPTHEGLPLEIYAFTNTAVLPEYESIQADIFDHLFSIIPEFNLKIYQSLSGADIQMLISSKVADEKFRQN